MGKYPTTPEELSAEALTALIRPWQPEAAVEAFRVVETKVYGDGMVSTSGRMVVELDYAPGGPNDLPGRVVIKTARPDLIAAGRQTHRAAWAIYANEVGVYEQVQPWKDVEAPRSLGGGYDPESGTFSLMLEDLRLRGGSFPNATTPVSLNQVRALLNELAKLHALYWESPRFQSDLAWLETHESGAIHDQFTRPDGICVLIQREVDTEPFKREMVERLGLKAADLYDGFLKLERHQARLPQTLLHGDTHIGNTYSLPGERGGFLDWQLSQRGYFMHDVSYLITTSLSVAARRANEQALLQHYLEQLRAEGVKTPPSFDEAWTEHSRAQVWNVYIGWLTTATPNYGWEISVMNHLRTMTAFEDLETAKLLAAMD